MKLSTKILLAIVAASSAWGAALDVLDRRYLEGACALALATSLVLAVVLIGLKEHHLELAERHVKALKDQADALRAIADAREERAQAIEQRARYTTERLEIAQEEVRRLQGLCLAVIWRRAKEGRCSAS